MQQNSSFVNKSANFSQTLLLKNILKPCLEAVNAVTLRNNVDDHTKQTNYYIIPNNNVKYYMFVVPKNKLDASNKSFDILYMFPDKQTQIDLQSNHVIYNTISDFCTEIDSVFDKLLLLEGYLYKEDTKIHYLITDILYEHDHVVTGDYCFRYSYIESMYNTLSKCENINNHMSINVHPVFNSRTESIMSIFKTNFKFKSQLRADEYIDNYKKTRKVHPIPQGMSKKKIVRNKLFPDVYDVYDCLKGNHQALLYVKGLKESKILKQKFADNDILYMDCTFNVTYNKWQPVLE